jgi:hypothetical protein
MNDEDKFSFVCCWTCCHLILDIGVNEYICSYDNTTITGRYKKGKISEPTTCENWNKTKK